MGKHSWSVKGTAHQDGGRAWDGCSHLYRVCMAAPKLLGFSGTSGMYSCRGPPVGRPFAFGAPNAIGPLHPLQHVDQHKPPGTNHRLMTNPNWLAAWDCKDSRTVKSPMNFKNVSSS